MTTLLLLIIVIQPSPEKFLETSDVRPFQIRVIESLTYHSAFIISVCMVFDALYTLYNMSILTFIQANAIIM